MARPRSGGNSNFSLANFKVKTKVLFLAVLLGMFGINLDGLDDLDDLDNGDVIDEVITDPLDSLYFDEEPDWNAADNFLESIKNSLLAVLLATPVGMLVAFSLWTIHILLVKAIISLSGHKTTTAQEVNSNSNMEMADFRDLGRVFGTPNDLPTTESTSTSETPVQIPISESPPNQSPSEISKFGSFKSTKSSIGSFKSSKDSAHDQG